MVGPSLITGGSGLIGRWVRHHWPEALGELVAPGRDEIDLLADGGPRRLLERYRPSRVIHLAWCASGTPGYREAPDNHRWVKATVELVAATDAVGATLWVTGTGADDDATNPDGYVAAKHELRQALAESVSQCHLGWMRPFHVFDPVAVRPQLVAHVRRYADSGRPVELQTPGARHDFVHAADVGVAVAHIVQYDLRGVVDIGTGTLTSVGDFVTHLGARWWAAQDGPGADHRGRVEHAADTSRLRATGWRPRRSEEFWTK